LTKEKEVGVQGKRKDIFESLTGIGKEKKKRRKKKKEAACEVYAEKEGNF